MGIDNIPDTFERVVRLDLHSGEGTNAINVREVSCSVFCLRFASDNL